MVWLLELGFFDLKTEDVTDPAEFNMKSPQHSPHTISLQDLARKGVTILGKMDNAKDNEVYFLPDAKQNVQFADTLSGKVKGMIDGFSTNGLIAPPPEDDLPINPTRMVPAPPLSRILI